jgi:hypothetical protein
MEPKQSRNELEKNPSFFRELIQFMGQNKKWWLIPIVVVLVLMGALLILGGTAAAPFIYTLF